MIGISVALLVHAGLGLPPYDVLASALSGRFGISLGQSGWLVAAVLFGGAALLGQRPSIWGLVYIVSNDRWSVRTPDAGGRGARGQPEGCAVIVGPVATPDLVTSAQAGGGSSRPAMRRRVLESV